MAISLVSHAIARATDTPTTAGIDTSGATFLALVIAAYTGGPSDAPSDSKGNTWTPLTSYVYSAGFMRITLYYAWNPTVGTSHTFSDNASGVYATVGGAAFSGVQFASDPLESSTGVSEFTTSTGGDMNTGGISYSAGCLVLATAGTPFGNTFGWSPTGSGSPAFTVIDALHDGSTEGATWAWWEDDGTGLAQCAWTPDIGTQQGAGAIAAFSPTGGGGGGNPWYAYAQQRARPRLPRWLRSAGGILLPNPAFGKAA